MAVSQTDFSTRIKHINKNAKKNRVRTKSTRRVTERFVTPLMLLCCMTGGLTAYWDYKDRPTDTPFEMAGEVSTLLMSYFVTI